MAKSIITSNIEVMQKPKGEIGMVLHEGGEYNPKNGKIEGGKILKESSYNNLIVNDASRLMAARLHPNNKSNGEDFLETTNGLQYLAVGVGILNDRNADYDPVNNTVDESLWSLQNPPAEDININKLEGELYRKEFTSVCFVDKSGNDTEDVTNVLKIVTTFYDEEAIGPLTEMGIFGGNATNKKDTGYMFNYKTFAVWNKPDGARLTITWKLTF